MMMSSALRVFQLLYVFPSSRIRGVVLGAINCLKALYSLISLSKLQIQIGED